MAFEDEDPVWETHTGGSGHSGPEWRDGDEALARSFYDSIADSARGVLDLLMDRPGEFIDAKEIFRYLRGREWREGDPNWRKSVAASLISISKVPSHEMDRRLPFYWWSPTEAADTRYGMKPSVARVFRDATQKAE